MVTQSLLTKTRFRDYSHIKPLPDPPRVPDMMKQFPSIRNFETMLSTWFQNRDDVFVGAIGYLWKTPEDGSGPYPDGTFVAGIEDPEWIFERNGYVISEAGKPPDLVLEVGSESTGRRDYTEKRDIYAEYGVQEYWRFDPSGGSHHDAALAGDRLVDGRYEPVEVVSESDGRHWGYSEVLGLEFWWEDRQLRFRDPVSGQFLRTKGESEDYAESEHSARIASDARAESEHTARIAADARAESERSARIAAEAARRTAETQAESERAARRTAEDQAESERAARRAAEARAAELEAENRRLRGDD